MNSNLNKYIHAEIGQWVKENVISEETATILRRRYPLTLTHKNNWGILISGCIGALLVGLGIIALTAANWDMFPRSTRTCFAFMPLVLSTLIALTAVARDVTTRRFWEPMGVFWSIAICSGILLVSQIYQVTEDFTGFIMICAATTLPVAYFTQSTILLALWPLLPIVWCATQFSDRSLLWAYPAVSVIIPAWIWYWRKNTSTIGRNIIIFLASLTLIITSGFIHCELIATHFSFSSESVMIVVPGALLLSAWGFLGLLLHWKHMTRVAFTGFLLLGMVTPFSREIRTWFDSFFDNMAHFSPLTWYFVGILIIWAILAGLSIWQTYRTKQSFLRSSSTSLLILSLLPFVLATVNTLTNPTCAVHLAFILFIVAGIVSCTKGIHLGQLARVNCGTLIILYSILVKFFASDMSFTIKGAVMIASGLIVIAINVIFMRWRRILRHMMEKEAAK